MNEAIQLEHKGNDVLFLFAFTFYIILAFFYTIWGAIPASFCIFHDFILQLARKKSACELVSQLNLYFTFIHCEGL